AVDELQLRHLRQHRVGNLPDTVSDEINHSGASEIHIAIACSIPHMNTLPAYCNRKILAEGTAEDRRGETGCEIGHSAIIRFVFADCQSCDWWFAKLGFSDSAPRGVTIGTRGACHVLSCRTADLSCLGERL